jgi:hypothetical protein
VLTMQQKPCSKSNCLGAPVCRQRRRRHTTSLQDPNISGPCTAGEGPPLRCCCAAVLLLLPHAPLQLRACTVSNSGHCLLACC